MAPRPSHMEEYRKLLALQIKLDIAAEIRQHPQIDAQSSVAAYEALASEASIDGLVRELAQEEAQEAIERGDTPAAPLLLLAGFRVNRPAEC